MAINNPTTEIPKTNRICYNGLSGPNRPGKTTAPTALATGQARISPPRLPWRRSYDTFLRPSTAVQYNSWYRRQPAAPPRARQAKSPGGGGAPGTLGMVSSTGRIGGRTSSAHMHGARSHYPYRLRSTPLRYERVPVEQKSTRPGWGHAQHVLQGGEGPDLILCRSSRAPDPFGPLLGVGPLKGDTPHP